MGWQNQTRSRNIKKPNQQQTQSIKQANMQNSILLIVAMLIAAASATGTTCTCPAGGILKDDMAKFPNVIHGRVEWELTSKLAAYPEYAGYRYYETRVIKNYKGCIQKKNEIVVKTPIECGMEFGAIPLFYLLVGTTTVENIPGKGSKVVLTTGACNANKLMTTLTKKHWNVIMSYASKNVCQQVRRLGDGSAEEEDDETLD
jgi:hypothetical protein